MGTKSRGGVEYFLTLLDDKTHYMWVYPLKTKDEVFQRIKEWQAEVENSTGRKLKTPRTDNGGEYVSNALEDHLKTCGIRYELTIPKTPEQNGAVERFNRTLVETTITMLLDAKLPKTPTSTVKGMTPYQAWFGQKPGVKHLRVFGCAAYTPTYPETKEGNSTQSPRSVLSLDMEMCVKAIVSSIMLLRRSCTAEMSCLMKMM